MLKCWPLSYAQQMFPCHLLKLCCLDTLRESERESERKLLTKATLSYSSECRPPNSCPSSNSILSSLKVFLNDSYIAII